MRLHLYLRMSRKDLENFRYRVDGLAIGQFVMVSVIPFAIILLLFVLGIDVIEWAFGPSGFWNQTTFIGFMATAFLPVFLAGMAFNALVLLAYALVRRIVHIRRYGIWNSPRNIARLLRSLENVNCCDALTYQVITKLAY